MDAATEGASQWGRSAVEDVTGRAGVEGAAPWRNRIEHRRRSEVE
jgi:hypothetical protein